MAPPPEDSGEESPSPLGFAYATVHSKRSRRMRIVVSRRGKVELRLPPGASARSGLSFLASQAHWVRQALSRTRPAPGLAAYLEEHPHLTLEGESWAVDLVETRFRHGWKLLEPERRVLVSKPSAEEDAFWREVLLGVGREVLPRRVQQLASGQGLRPSRVSVRDQWTRWGSCSAQGRISLNWRLLLLPPELQDYVLWHELAHCLHLNHGPAFWECLRGFVPDALHLDRALNRVGRDLICLGRSD